MGKALKASVRQGAFRRMLAQNDIQYMRDVGNIAFVLPIPSKATVKTHLSNIYGKLSVSKRRDAVREAKRLGLV